MSDFEVMRYLTFGQYLPTGSVLHRLDPRVKLLATVLIMVTFMAKGNFTILCIGFFSLIILFPLGKLSLRHAFRGLIPLLPLFAFVFILQLLFYPHKQTIIDGGPVLWKWNGVMISWASLISIGMMAVRMMSIVLLFTLFTNLSDVSDFTHGIDGLLRPFQRLGFPAHEVTLVLVVTFRFVPTLGQELERLMKAQAARGGEFSNGWGFKRVQQTIPLFVPLFVATLRRSEELAVAMEARGYAGGRGRTRLVNLHMRFSDWFALLIVLGACLISFVL